MKTMLLDTVTWDVITDASGNIAVANDPYSVAQDVASAVRTFLGEVYYNTSLGIPYLGAPPGTTGNAILGQLPPLAVIKSKIAAAAATIPGCNNPVVFVSGLGNDRVLRGQVQFTDSNGQVQSIAF